MSEDMTNEQAITVLNMIEAHGSLPIQAKEKSIKALELLDALTDRPCAVCVHHKENGCCKWDCVFDGHIGGKKRNQS